MMEDILEFITGVKKVKLISHNDADGITSGYILYRVLKKLGADVEWLSLPYMTENGLAKALDTDRPVVFIDMGSSYGDWIAKHRKAPVAVIDHHPVRGSMDAVDAWWVPAAEKKVDTIKYATASTLAQKIAVELGLDDSITAWMAIIGSTGDMADIEGDFRKDSLIVELIDKAIRDGHVVRETGLRLYGKFAFDEYELIDFSVLPPTVGDYKHLRGVNPEELTREDVEGVYGKYTDMVWNTRYINPEMPPEFRENHDAAVALMNITPDLPARVIEYLKRGDDFGFARAAGENLRRKYADLKGTVKTVLEKNLYTVAQKVTVVYNPDPSHVPNSMLANYIANKNIIGSPEKPVIVYSKDPNNGKYLASARIHYDYQGTVDLGALMKAATGDIPGATGGGHPVAAGATIPENRINRFIEKLFLL